MPPSPTESNRIDASPTKEFFISMLTRDVQLTRVMTDLVDNSVDGAKRLRPGGDYSGLSVRISIAADGFEISDNSGGIPVDIASTYAFRFGRPPEAINTPESMRLFDAGMKRTFFKLGKMLSIESRCRTESFTRTVDVDKWLAPQRSVDAKEQDSPDPLALRLHNRREGHPAKIAASRAISGSEMEQFFVPVKPVDEAKQSQSPAQNSEEYL